MSEVVTKVPTEGLDAERVLGIYDRGDPGPTLLVLSGIHGNEPAGVHACRRVLAALERDRPDCAGRVVFLAGNLQALRAGRRFVDRDLNRQWTAANVARVLATDAGLRTTEDREQAELIHEFERFEASATGPVVFLDLHTSSADGSPFSCLGDTLANRRLAMALPVPVILGLEECIDGAVMEYFDERGHVGLAVEGGRHGAPASVDNLESSVWIALWAGGLLRSDRVELDRHREVLRRASGGLPPVMEIRYRHAITPEMGFTMVPGFESFEAVPKGKLLAMDCDGEIRATRAGRVLLPLYQGQGDDGFFFGTDVARFWLGVSTLMRRLGLAKIVHWAPGVARDPDDPMSVLVNKRVARWRVADVFHLLGFRKKRDAGATMRFSRRWSRADNRAVRPRR